MVGGVFSHTYPERIWPKRAGISSIAPRPDNNKGIRYDYGDLADMVDLLKREPETRQAYLPIWFPEDTGAPSYQRVPCTLGYHFIRRHGFFHMTYYIRSCDIIRHFRDDIYLALKLYYWIKDVSLPKTIPGLFTMHIVSLHCFYNERGLLKIEP
jgi:thymidylate synthase